MSDKDEVNIFPSDEELRTRETTFTDLINKYSFCNDTEEDGYDIDDLITAFEETDKEDEENFKNIKDFEAMEVDDADSGSDEIEQCKNRKEKEKALSNIFGKDFLTEITEKFNKRRAEVEKLNLTFWKNSKTFESFNESNLHTPNFKSSSRQFVKATEESAGGSTSNELCSTNQFRAPFPMPVFQPMDIKYPQNFSFAGGPSFIIPNMSMTPAHHELPHNFNQHQMYNLRVREVFYDYYSMTGNDSHFMQPIFNNTNKSLPSTSQMAIEYTPIKENNQTSPASVFLPCETSETRIDENKFSSMNVGKTKNKEDNVNKENDAKSKHEKPNMSSVNYKETENFKNSYHQSQNQKGKKMSKNGLKSNKKDIPAKKNKNQEQKEVAIKNSPNRKIERPQSILDSDSTSDEEYLMDIRKAITLSLIDQEGTRDNAISNKMEVADNKFQKTETIKIAEKLEDKQGKKKRDQPKDNKNEKKQCQSSNAHYEEQKDKLPLKDESKALKKKEVVVKSNKNEEQDEEVTTNKKQDQKKEVVTKGNKNQKQDKEVITKSNKNQEQKKEFITKGNKNQRQDKEVITESNKNLDQKKEVEPKSYKSQEQDEEVTTNKKQDQKKEVVKKGNKNQKKDKEVITKSNKNQEQNNEVVTKGNKSQEQMKKGVAFKNSPKRKIERYQRILDSDHSSDDEYLMEIKKATVSLIDQEGTRNNAVSNKMEVANKIQKTEIIKITEKLDDEQEEKKKEEEKDLKNEKKQCQSSNLQYDDQKDKLPPKAQPKAEKKKISSKSNKVQDQEKKVIEKSNKNQKQGKETFTNVEIQEQKIKTDNEKENNIVSKKTLKEKQYLIIDSESSSDEDILCKLASGKINIEDFKAWGKLLHENQESEQEKGKNKKTNKEDNQLLYENENKKHKQKKNRNRQNKKKKLPTIQEGKLSKAQISSRSEDFEGIITKVVVDTDNDTTIDDDEYFLEAVRKCQDVAAMSKKS